MLGYTEQKLDYQVIAMITKYPANKSVVISAGDIAIALYADSVVELDKLYHLYQSIVSHVAPSELVNILTTQRG